jgi:hypothetical protein
MKLGEHSNKLETNVENETQDFGIGDASVIIDILRNRLYERKIPTSCQEYICNARDAMREAGKGNEFEITVPTRLNPVFKVNPADVVCVPVDYNGTKMRTCRFQVIQEVSAAATDDLRTFDEGEEDGCPNDDNEADLEGSRWSFCE